MKLLVVFVFVAALCGIALSTTALEDVLALRAARDNMDEAPETTMDDDDDARMVALNAYETFGEDWNDWDEGHTLAWMYGNKAVLTLSDAHTESIGCSCSGTKCSCCLKFRLLWKNYSACLVAYYSAGEIGVKATLNGNTVVERSVSVSRTSVSVCKRVVFAKFCVGLSDIRLSSNSVSARGKVEVRGVISKSTRRFTLHF